MSVIKHLANEAKSANIAESANIVVTDLKTGLTKQEIEALRSQHGANEFTKPKERGLFWELFDVFKEPLMVILIIASGLSFLVGEYQDGIGICMAVLLGIIIGRVTEGRSKKAAESLAKMTEDVLVTVLRDGKKQKVRKTDIVPNDLVYLETGDMVPADGVVLESTDLKLREDMLTGEVDQVKKDKEDLVYGGTLVGNGQGLIQIVKIGDQTEMGAIAKDLNQEEQMTPLQLKLGKLGQIISSISSGVAAILFVYMLIQILKDSHIQLEFSSFGAFIDSLKEVHFVFPSIKTAFIVCVGLIVAAVPEGLPTMVNITLAMTMAKMAKINVLIRKKEACETIGSVSVICSDKTGTLTENKMKVGKLFANGHETLFKEVNDYPLLVENCLVNSSAEVEFNGTHHNYLGNPTEGAIIAMVNNPSYQHVREKANIVYQIPFASSNKYMLTVTKHSMSYHILSKGAPEVILKQCKSELVDGKIRPLTKVREQAILDQMKELQSNAMRIIAFASAETTRKEDFMNKKQWFHQLTFQGFVGINDPLREGVKESIECARDARIETKILTGDNIHTAIAIGNEIGILTPDKRAVEASYIDGLTDEQLREEVKSIAIVARSMPNTKMRIVSALQENGEVVAVTGDGINDAPALTKADVGIAMGIAGTEVSRNAADIILTDDSFNTIVEAIKWGRGIYNNFQRYLQFTLTVNIIAFLLTIISQLLDQPLPFTTIHLLWVNIIMDGPPALALGLEPVRQTVMKRKPTSKNASIINRLMINTIVMNSIFMILVLLAQLKYNFLGANLDHVTHGASEGQTVIFSLFVSLVLFNALNCREFGLVSIFKNFLKNKIALLILAGTFIIQVIVTQLAGGFFHTVPLSAVMWLKIVAVGSTVVLFNEILKWVLRLINQTRRRVRRAKKRRVATTNA
ncbi:calcium-translocating P-type ATPase, PMCA-type [Turicibacter sp. 1E2]|uniref:P-type Ca(2+) transporter n=1 Tax=Turicibacter faecis TaxID=2963365 RepID=A0ABM8INR0_9FIRM|nr:calcium-translocating P-type ATPase, PMCA-type [Turicibacter sp. 1E2]MCU7208848.1 calcium-translocating P-type ATPase, PMCA-type [Turicibacter sp. 1E2]BEH90840.1 calcium-translocating P-type ATPase, PMCA-type [Turicibacter sp. TC023]